MRELLAQCEASELDLQQQQQQHQPLPSMPSLLPSPAVAGLAVATDSLSSRRTKVCCSRFKCMRHGSLVSYLFTLAVFFLIKTRFTNLAVFQRFYVILSCFILFLFLIYFCTFLTYCVIFVCLHIDIALSSVHKKLHVSA